MGNDALAQLLGMDWHGMLLPAISVAEKVLRTLIVFVFLVFALRLSGKREIAQLNPFDFIVLLVLSNTLQNAVIGNDNSITGGLIGAASLLLINWVINRFITRHQGFEKLLVGKKRVLVQNGKIDQKALDKELITLQELEMAAHKQGIPSLDEVASAELDPDGELFFIAKTPPPEILRHKELMRQITLLSQEIEALKLLVSHGPSAGPASAIPID